MTRTTALVWFRRDLRLEDNPAWSSATSGADRVAALHVLDPAAAAGAGPLRLRRLRAHLRALDEALRERGGALVVRTGDPRSVVPAAAAELGATTVALNADVSGFARRRDRDVVAALERNGVATESWWGSLVLPPGSVRSTSSGRTHRVFTPFHRAWSATAWDPWPAPGDAELVAAPGEDLGPQEHRDDDPRPGSAGATDRLGAWLERVDDYPERRDRPDDDAGTSHLSEDLRWGTLSPRTVAEAVGTHTPGRAAFVRQLAWRDWYAHLLHDEPRLARHALDPRLDRVAWLDDEAGFRAWREGRTGYPVVDAGMRQLAATGWMHNRVRMITASFLVKDLLVDWRRGEAHFRELLVDFEVSQNVGNWQWVAGTGPDAAPYFRVFNPVTQGRRFDPAGDYVRRWVPELAGLTGAAVHAPWELPPLELAAAGVTLGVDYPHPVVDHAVARDRAVAAYRAAREGT